MHLTEQKEAVITREIEKSAEDKLGIIIITIIIIAVTVINSQQQSTDRGTSIFSQKLSSWRHSDINTAADGCNT